MTELLVLWKSLGIRAAIDIAIIAAVFFVLVHTFRVSGTARIAAGLMIAGAIFVLANLLDLRGITWIYSRLSPVLLIAAVVIFQPELPRMLERGGVCGGGPRRALVPGRAPGSVGRDLGDALATSDGERSSCFPASSRWTVALEWYRAQRRSKHPPVVEPIRSAFSGSRRRGGHRWRTHCTLRRATTTRAV